MSLMSLGETTLLKSDHLNECLHLWATAVSCPCLPPTSAFLGTNTTPKPQLLYPLTGYNPQGHNVKTVRVLGPDSYPDVLLTV